MKARAGALVRFGGCWPVGALTVFSLWLGSYPLIVYSPGYAGDTDCGDAWGAVQHGMPCDSTFYWWGGRRGSVWSSASRCCSLGVYSCYGDARRRSAEY